MDYYTLKLFKLTYLNVDLEKSFVTHITDDKSILSIFLKSKMKACKICGCYNIKVRSTTKTKVNHSIYSDLKIELYIHRRKYFFSDCGHYFTEENPIVSSNRNISIMTDFRILELLKDPTNTYSKVASFTSTSITYVQNVFDKYVNIKLGNLSTVICIDEVYAKRLTKHKYCCVLYAPQWKKIVDILPSRHKLNLIDYFARIPISEKDKVEYISMDLWDSYKEMAQLCFPKAKVCADPFHIIKHLLECFRKIRIDVMKRFEHLKHEDHNFYWLYKKYFKFLETDLSKLPDSMIKVSHSGMYLSKYQIIEYMLELDDKLALAYLLKEEYRNFNSKATIDNACEWLDELILKFKQSCIKEYIPFWHILMDWHDEIINSFNRINNHKITNGPMERVNRDIKNLFSISFGSTNFERVRNRIMFYINDNSPILGYRKKLTNKRTGKPRGKYNK